jgi:hypothetical protein
MAVPFLTSINLNQNELLNASLQKLGSDPTNPVTGQIFYHTGENRIKYYDGSGWIPLTDDILGAAPIQIADDGQGNITISIDEAVASTDGAGGSRGTLSATDKEKLDDATAENTANTLVERDANGNIRVSDPVVDSDAATKAYVDATAQGLDIKLSVRAATDAPVTLSGTQTIDGVPLVAGDRVLVKEQTDATENGIYVVASGAWARSEDADEDSEVNPGMFTFVEEGTTYENTGWVVATDGAITLGTTSIEFVQFSGAGLITAGGGLTKSGNTIDVVGTVDRITVNADSIDIASTYAGQTSITTLGTITTGTWNADIIDVLYGGTGADNAVDARANLNIPGRYSETIGDGTNTDYTINHGLNTQDVQVFLRENASPYQQVFADVEVTDANNVLVRTASALDSNELRVTVVG